MRGVTEASLLDRYQRLIEISRDLASTLDLGILLNRIVHAAADLCTAEAASILLYDEIKQELFFEAATNLEKTTMRDLIVPVENSLAGWIIKNKEPIITSDTQSDPRHFDRIAKATNVTTTSMLGVPLIAKDKVVGVLEVINKLLGDFNEQDLNLLVALGAQAAVAIENTRLFNQSDLISELVHELRTPLTSLGTAARLLARQDIPEKTRDNMANVILLETNRLSEMASMFLDLARLESGRVQFQREYFNVKALLLEAANQMAEKAREREIQLRLNVPDNLPALRADRDKIKQVLLNLLSNAIKYNREQGTITVSAQAQAEQIVLRVADTGPGIPPESIKHIFEKFYRVPGAEKVAPGTGLGLSISKRIVEAHLGHIKLESELGVGTTFSVFLPLDWSESSH